MKHFVLSLVAAAALCSPAAAQQKVKNLYASSETLDLAQLQNTEQPVQLNRHLFAGYNTLCLPVSVSADQLQDVRLERLVGIHQEGSTLNLYFLDCTAEGIQAGQPYLVCSPRSQYLRIKNTEAQGFSQHLTTVRVSDEQGNAIRFGSSWNAVRQDGRYGIPAKQDAYPLESVLIRTEADKAFLPTRCGFDWESQSTTATELRIRHIQSPDEATGISGLGTKPKAEGSVYDLSGRKVSTAKKGVVIENGKKVLK